ncbi:hypothetical protein AM1_B0176 (plasmid) [Acaryochloris marina MBIC11017]|uniref:Uncharacterized protein n=1 Tax=Acaryochloris marina (strain MBIC 11017) TaxID=329726 RepID=A8ZL71_ACAM1|nr:hypothetical protein AM1_B0176 [Acaryochloris marina MBIC11017]
MRALWTLYTTEQSFEKDLSNSLHKILKNELHPGQDSEVKHEETSEKPASQVDE